MPPCTSQGGVMPRIHKSSSWERLYLPAGLCDEGGRLGAKSPLYILSTIQHKKHKKTYMNSYEIEDIFFSPKMSFILLNPSNAYSRKWNRLNNFPSSRFPFPSVP